MKVKVIKDAYYNLEYIKAGRIIEFKGKNLPSWATLADGVQTKQGKKEDDKKSDEKDNPPCIDGKDVNQTSLLDNVGQGEQGEGETPVNPDEKENADLDNVGQGEEVKDENPQLPDVKKAEYLDELINQGIEKGILIEDADKKSVDEQIAELEKALNK